MFSKPRVMRQPLANSKLLDPMLGVRTSMSRYATAMLTA